MVFEDEQDQTSQDQGINPYAALIERNRQIQARIDSLKAVKTPQLSDPSESPDDPERLSTEVLRGLFRAQIPTSNDPKFGDVFRQSVSPGREVLANMLNGMSASFLGTKFKSVRDQAFEKFVTEQKLSQEQQQIRQTLQIHAAQLAQNVIKDKQDLALKREVENIRSSENDAKQAASLLKLEQAGGKQNIDLLKMLAQDEQNKRQNAAAVEKAKDTGDHIWDAARRAIEAKYKANGMDVNDPEVAAAVQRDTTGEWKRMLQLKEAVKPDTKGKHDYTGLTQVVLKHPEMWNSLPAEDKRNLAVPLDKAGFEGWGRPLSNTEVQKISDNRTALTLLNGLKETIKNNQEYLGPVTGFFGNLNPTNVRAKTIQAEIARVKQEVGYMLERGVLREGDEKKYQEMLSKLTDVPALALNKVDGLIGDVTGKLDRYLEELGSGGRNVSKMKQTVEGGKSSGGTVKMVFPGGVERDVPAGEVDEAVSKYKGKRK